MRNPPTSSSPSLTDPTSDKHLVFLRVHEVCARLGVKKSKLYSLLSGGFPAPAKIGTASVWLEEEVEDFMKKRLKARSAQGGPA
jgi:predicted DNA-binding transcriptional regulator AlpA